MTATKQPELKQNFMPNLTTNSKELFSPPETIHGLQLSKPKLCTVTLVRGLNSLNFLLFQSKLGQGKVIQNQN